MDVIPAIDLRGGRCVRLRQGDFGRETVYDDDPVSVASRWEQLGARRLHLVDLDGARTGRAAHVHVVRQIVQSIRIPCQLGGGVRDTAAVDDWLAAGLDRVIVGTQALRDPEWFGQVVNRFRGRVALGLDARDGMVATDGWLEVSQVSAVELATRFDTLALAAVIYTDIGRDGMLTGPNVEATAALTERLSAPVIASGGIGNLDHLRSLARLPLAGCIVGRALYDGCFTLPEAIAALAHPGCAAPIA